MSDPRREQKDITADQVARVFRNLAEDHAAECAQLAAERTWRRLEHKLELQAQRTWGQRVIAQFRTWPLFDLWRVFGAGLTRHGSFAGRVGAWIPRWIPASRPSVLAFAGALAIAAGTVVWFQQPGNLRFEVVGGHTEAGWLHSQETPVLLEFSDGSELQLRANSSISFNVIGRRSAITRVSKGDLRVDVRHAENTDWRFFAGPFEVRVVGTKFDLGWRDDKLTVAMREGQVRILGADQEWTVRAGERFEMTAPGKLAQRAPAVPAASGDTVINDVVINDTVSSDTPRSDTPNGDDTRGEFVKTDPAQQDGRGGFGVQGRGRAHGNRGASAVDAQARAPQSWTQLLARGEFSALLNAARETGIDSAIQSRSSGDLVALAQAARYSKEPGLARKVWQGVRSRFGGSAAARDAAFFLARIHEQAGQRSTALELYSAYLHEGGQSGAYAPEAAGRRLVLLRDTNPAAARDEARRYLAQFPSGSYAKLAQDTVISQK